MHSAPDWLNSVLGYYQPFVVGPSGNWRTRYEEPVTAVRSHRVEVFARRPDFPEDLLVAAGLRGNGRFAWPGLSFQMANLCFACR